MNTTIHNDQAHRLNHELLEVAALLDVAAGLIPLSGANSDGLHDDASRLAALLHAANDKVRRIVSTELAPFV
jgi:hypothetical protein